MLTAVQNQGTYVLRYRLQLGEGVMTVDLRGALVNEKDGPQLIVGINRVENPR